MSEIRDCKDLQVWELGITIVKDIYAVTAKFPKSEQFGLTNQMRRASVSIPSNIAEGHVRNMTKEFCRYLNISLGSCAELETQLIIAKELGWLDLDDFKRLSENVKTETRKLNALKISLSEP